MRTERRLTTAPAKMLLGQKQAAPLPGVTLMKAIIMDRHGGLEVLRCGDLPDPVAGEGQAVIDIHAASVNGADCKVREGGSYATVSTFPYVLGRDFSGTVASLGA